MLSGLEDAFTLPWSAVDQISKSCSCIHAFPISLNPVSCTEKVLTTPCTRVVVVTQSFQIYIDIGAWHGRLECMNWIYGAINWIATISDKILETLSNYLKKIKIFPSIGSLKSAPPPTPALFNVGPERVCITFFWINAILSDTIPTLNGEGEGRGWEKAI